MKKKNEKVGKIQDEEKMKEDLRTFGKRNKMKMGKYVG